MGSNIWFLLGYNAVSPDKSVSRFPAWGWCSGGHALLNWGCGDCRSDFI